MGKAELFFGGIPTKPDVDKIARRWPTHALTPGQTIPYREVAEVIGETVRSNRFRSVTNAWRKSVEPGHFIGADGQGHFVVMTESDKLALGQAKMKTAGRLVRRSVIVGTMIDVKSLSEEERQAHQRLQDRQSKIRAAMQLRQNGHQEPPSLLE